MQIKHHNKDNLTFSLPKVPELQKYKFSFSRQKGRQGKALKKSLTNE